ncbi:MAG: ribonuclease HII [Saprospiraceae bacterium]|nr:ribonuclease HII [Saprospiraceae bacterium]
MKSFHTSDKIEAGCDEAGRGCLAGPVFAAAVILPPDFFDPELTDSKKLNHKTKERLRNLIEKEALAYAVASSDHSEIDKNNILRASILTMHKALEKLNMSPELILVDGNKFLPFRNIAYECIIKGDGKYFSIAAASVLAKTYRDDYMHTIHQEYPVYGWDVNKGYPTEAHRKGISEFGPSPYHRMTFRLLPEIKQGVLF